MTANRRRFLHLSGSVAIGAVAGCFGDSEDNGQTTSQATTTKSSEKTSRLTTTQADAKPEFSGEQQAKLAAADGDRFDKFGCSAAMSGNGSTALIGAQQDENPNGENSGSAYVFRKSNQEWRQQAKLIPDDGDSTDYFGHSVAVSRDGSTALVGAWKDETPDDEINNAGSVYVFERSGESWTQQAKFQTDNSGRFGSTLALSKNGTTALIGAAFEFNGAAYLFAKADGSWSRQAKLTADDGDRMDLFGIEGALSDDGTTAVLGATRDHEPNGNASGSAYVFNKSNGTWRQQAKLAANDGDGSDRFGSAVAVSSDGATTLIGAMHDEDPHGVMAGSAYIFDKSGESWSQQAKLVADDGNSGFQFGYSADISSNGKIAVVGADSDRHGSAQSHAGSAYVFYKTGAGWSQQIKLDADDADSNDRFGSSIALSRDATKILIGARQDEHPNGEKAGSAYVFSL
jgi:hypothetical protein